MVYRSTHRELALPNLIGLDRDELSLELEKKIGIPEKKIRMRVSQIWQWIYLRGHRSFDGMTNLDQKIRSDLTREYCLIRPQIVNEQRSEDGTIKWLLRFRGTPLPIEVETVYIPEYNRGTLCLSSQVGCSLNCSFCNTGSQKFVRNLTSEEILMQLIVAREKLGDFLEKTENSFEKNRKVTNIVMMGMGEPLYNFENVKKALLIISDSEGLSLSKRRITLSTSGVIPNIRKIGTEIKCMLAVSLHATRDEVRSKIMPINKKYPISQLLEACRTYLENSNAKSITFEYVMLKGINDSLQNARELVKLLKCIPAKINLIPFNPWPGSEYESSEQEQIKCFASLLKLNGYPSSIRTPRGQDILAACGQLKSQSQRFKETVYRLSL
ncbi:23S rRNA (adenine(2503)-C(2))-methyltransferase RlmN [Candidatus Endowatersipora endosymbiont of Watersipora subatra]|uniref:23S rRNA (adenine(2503)-C(2))-methyltransferase RlmN n=1 Tax=Candidatus Endowatersipora endosymbiont of Watersipora subatra TaxID=3077946 RepID=UPI00312C77B7